jgi:hypothetical protein
VRNQCLGSRDCQALTLENFGRKRDSGRRTQPPTYPLPDYTSGRTPTILVGHQHRSHTRTTTSYQSWYPFPPIPTRAELTPPFQLDKIVGMAMLVLAASVFLYYTAWTLLMVLEPSIFCSCLLDPLRRSSTATVPMPFPCGLYTSFRTLTFPIALRRRNPPFTNSLPTARLGHPHPRHPHPPRFNGRRLVSVYGHDTK